MKRIFLLLLMVSITFTAYAKKPIRPHIVTRGAFVAMFVPDLESSVKWYTEKLGLEVIDRPPASDAASVAILEGGGLIVELIQSKEAGPKAKGFVQGIFKAGVIIDDFDSTVELLEQRGVDIAFGPFPKRGKQRANVIIRDNAGNMIQLFGY